MDIILTEDVEKLGKRGDRIAVRDGFFRNYLAPQRKAIACTQGNLRALEALKKREAARAELEKGQWQEVAKKLEGLTLTLRAKVGEGDKLFGSVTHGEIAEGLRKEGVEVDRKKIETEPIKMLGEYRVRIRLHPEIESFLKVKVVKG